MHNRSRPAVAMIELIFSLVVMGIAVMSAPMLIATSSSSISVALQQEGINEAAARISMIMTYPWDERDVNTACIPPVLRVTNGHPALNEIAATGRRIGVPIDTNSHTFRCGIQVFNATTPLGIEVPGVLDDIDDFQNNGVALNPVVAGAGGNDYIEQNTVQMQTAIFYANEPVLPLNHYNQQIINFIPGAALGGVVQTSNIKSIRVTLTSNSPAQELNQKRIILNAFSCNIGGYQYARRTL